MQGSFRGSSSGSLSSLAAAEWPSLPVARQTTQKSALGLRRAGSASRSAGSRPPSRRSSPSPTNVISRSNSIPGCSRPSPPSRTQSSRSSAHSSGDDDVHANLDIFLPPRDCSVPDQLTLAERHVLRKLVQVAAKRRKSKRKPIPVICFTDVGNDIDDTIAIVVLSIFVRLGIYDLRLVVVNTYPTDERARLARGLLDALGIKNVPVALGDNKKIGLAHQPVYYYEFAFRKMASKNIAWPDRNSAVKDVLLAAKAAGEQVRILNIGTQRDLYEISKIFPSLLKEVVASVHIQGGHIWEDRALKPASFATNAKNDWEAAEGWHRFLQTSDIPFVSYTKLATFSAPPLPKIFDMLPDSTTNPVTEFLRKVALHQAYTFYWNCLYPNRRAQSTLTQEFFLANLTSYPALADSSDEQAKKYDIKALDAKMPIAHSGNHKAYEPNTPDGCEEFYRVLGPYLKYAFYDVIPAIGLAGGAIPTILGVRRPAREHPHSLVSGTIGRDRTDHKTKPTGHDLRNPLQARKKWDKYVRHARRASQMDPVVHPIAVAALLKVALRPDWIGKL